MSNAIIVNLFKHGADEFIELLNESGIQHQERRLFPPGTITAAPEMIEIIGVAAGSVGLASAMAAVAVQWLKNKASRKLIVTTSDGKMIHAEGFSLKELQEVIEQAEKIDVIQTKPDQLLDE